MAIPDHPGVLQEAGIPNIAHSSNATIWLELQARFARRGDQGTEIPEAAGKDSSGEGYQWRR